MLWDSLWSSLEILCRRAGPPGSQPGCVGTAGEPPCHPDPTPVLCSRGWAVMGDPVVSPSLGSRGWWHHPTQEGCGLGHPDWTWGDPNGTWLGRGGGLGALRATGAVLAGDGVRAARQAGKALWTGRSGKRGCKSAAGDSSPCSARPAPWPHAPACREALVAKGFPLARPHARETGTGCSRSPSRPWPLRTHVWRAVSVLRASSIYSCQPPRLRACGYMHGEGEVGRGDGEGGPGSCHAGEDGGCASRSLPIGVCRPCRGKHLLGLSLSPSPPSSVRCLAVSRCGEGRMRPPHPQPALPPEPGGLPHQPHSPEVLRGGHVLLHEPLHQALDLLRVGFAWWDGAAGLSWAGHRGAGAR